jgi:hypothetical protein
MSVHLRYNPGVEASKTIAALRALEDSLMTTPKPELETVDSPLLGRRAVIRGGLAGGFALAAALLGIAVDDADAAAKPKKPAKKPAKPKKPVKAAGSSSGSNGSNNGGDNTGTPTNGGNNTGNSNTGNSGTGTNGGNGAPGTGTSNTGADKGGDVTGPSVTKPPTTGGTNKQPTLRCRTVGDKVIAGPAGSPPTVIPGGKVCEEVP